MTSSSKRVAIVGASGIGKHHGKWWTLEGADVCAFAGTSPESVAKAEAGLKELFGFAGRGYTDINAMLERERPDIVDICSPPARHYVHVRQVLESGFDVFCEKPFVYGADVPVDTLRAQAAELERLAQDRGRRLGLCVQYATGGAMFHELWKARFGERPITRYEGHLEAPAKGRGPDPFRVWADLGPHPLSVLHAIAPDGRMTGLRVRFDDYDAEALFRMECAAGGIDCEILVRNSTDPPQNVREFKFDDYLFRVEGETDEQGVYCARIETPDGAHRRPDMMRVRIRQFLDGEPSIARETALNTDLVLDVLAAARQAARQA